MISGPTGVGKSWLACALGHKACRDGFSVLYRRAPRLFSELAVAGGEGRLPRMLATLERTRLRIPGSCRPRFRQIVAQHSGLKSPGIPI